MAEDDKLVLIYTTFGDMEDAKRVGRELVAAKLAGCVNILPGMVSIFEWEGALGEASEVVMIIKTRASLMQEAMAEAARLHPYEVPALLVLPVQEAGRPYRNWLLDQTMPAA
jgi:periplasmic divalent cation tolerance protein